MNKLNLIIISISIGTTAMVSTLFGFAGQTIIGTFWGWFTVTFLFQIILFAIYNSHLIQKDKIVIQQLENQALSELSKFTVRLLCSYCQQPNITPIQLNQKNTFKCESCNQVNGVSMQFLATSLTTPIQNVKIPVADQEKVEFKIT